MENSACLASRVASCPAVGAPFFYLDEFLRSLAAIRTVTCKFLLHQSTIINSPNLIAQSKIWTVTGADVAPGGLGSRARLFKSGALCQAVDYRYNTRPAAEVMVGTAAQCGTGWYNSHGFVASRTQNFLP